MDVVIDCNFRQQVRMGERRPEKAGGGSIPSLATIESITYRTSQNQFHSV